jgi:hypothetical protein
VKPEKPIFEIGAVSEEISPRPGRPHSNLQITNMLIAFYNYVSNK